MQKGLISKKILCGMKRTIPDYVQENHVTLR